jgi:hypothetical protein
VRRLGRVFDGDSWQTRINQNELEDVPYGSPFVVVDHLALTRFVPMQMKRRGVEMRIVLEGDSSPSQIDLPLFKAVARTCRWSDDLISGCVGSVDELARRKAWIADPCGG